MERYKNAFIIKKSDFKWNILKYGWKMISFGTI